MFRALLLIGLALAPARAAAPATAPGGADLQFDGRFAPGPVTNLPVPRFVSLKRSEVNMRRGPGDDHPIVWVYRRKTMPLEVTNEFDTWLKVRDIDGDEGWVSRNMLSGEPRYALVRPKSGKAASLAPTNDPLAGWPMRRHPEAKAETVAILEPGVIAEIRRCPNEPGAWCEVRAGKSSGWVERSALWGVFPQEVIK